MAFKVLQYQVRKEVKKRIKQSLPKEELILIKIAKQDKSKLLEWENSHEFFYQNNLYDVIKSNETEDTIYYQCINDTQEKALFDNLEGHILQHIRNDKATGKKAEQILKKLYQEYFAESFELQLYYPKSFPVFSFDIFIYTSLFLKTPTPPPKTIFLC